MNIGERIKKRRKQIDMSAETLAEKLGIAPSTIYRYESGDINKVSSEMVMQFADILRITPGWIMGWEEEPYDLNNEERKLLFAYRNAERQAQLYALQLLENNPLAKKESHA